MKAKPQPSRPLVLLTALLLALTTATSAQASASRNILWEIVTHCLDTTAGNYCTSCRSPRTEASCASGLSCKETTEVWAESANYVALRDRKMCGCPDDFVHGLAIPRAKVTGVEDPSRPAGIWEFAWQTAVKRIGDPEEAALAVNPPGRRDQDQLHVHMLRLRKDARTLFAKAHLAHIQKLDEVWCAAGKAAAAAGFKDYGVLVASDPAGGFIVLVDQASPEKTYAIARCIPVKGER